MRNPEFGVGHLEKWAEMLQILKDISGNRMPSVADLLKQAAPGRRAVAATAPTDNGADRPGRSGPAAPGKPSEPTPRSNRARAAVPPVVDRESSQNSPHEKPAEPASPAAQQAAGAAARCR